MISTTYDEMSRHLVNEAPALLNWALRAPPARLPFRDWLNPILTPGEGGERICDALARFSDEDRGGFPVAGLIELQTKPHPLMFGRLLVAAGLVWQLVKPAPHAGDRFDLVALVINLTGVGDCAREMKIHGTALMLVPREVNLSAMSAGDVLDEIAAGKVPREVLAFIP